MSLVEQAIARMRNQATAKAGQPDGAPKPVVPAPLLDPLPDLPKPQKHMTLDTLALRLEGYLPEEGRERQFTEHYRRIKRPLIDKALAGTAAVGEPHVIMVTSALPGDGKTFTSINLALSMALERDISVLLVDCDVAKRHITEVMGLKADGGLLDALVDESIDIESLVVQTNVRGLSILPAGRRMEAAAELLSSNRMRHIVGSLCARHPRRIVVLDSPPLLITNEGRALVKMAGQVVLVVRAGHTPQNAVQEAMALFDMQQAGGVILNQVMVSSIEGYYGYGSYGANETHGNAP
jgi:exopolysaccharide/PEP-CTERM locus tyrosine autokinase